MKTLFCYATEQTRALLEDNSEKALLIGGDFGYGNFGDILQLKGAIGEINKTGRYNPVIVFATDAIRNRSFPNDIQGFYGTKMFIFVSETSLILDPQEDPKIIPIHSINNVSLLHLYGGGFLNQYWGSYVLDVVEFFLSSNDKLEYFISGQQVTAPFESNFAEHVNKYKPSLIGVRDRKSGELLASQGVSHLFSFDDATEELLKLATKVKLQKGDGLFLHLNSSSYTANPDLIRRKRLSEIGQDLELIRPFVKRNEQVNLLQAYIDARDDVCDTIETIKGLETGFPFPITKQILLPLLCDNSKRDEVADSLGGQFGYSCSYHVALWLRLAGIPCWLRGANAFYKQKSEGLGISQTLPQFLQDPKVPDFSTELDQRNQWLEIFRHHLLDINQGQGQAIHFKKTDPQINSRTFNYKGYPTKAQLLVDLCTENEKTRAWAAEREGAIVSLQESNEKMYAETRALAEENARLLSRETVAEERILALTELVTSHGSKIHELLQLNLESAQPYKDEIQRIFSTRSWRFTKPMRALARFIRHGYFDSHGKIRLGDLWSIGLNKMKKLIFKKNHP